MITVLDLEISNISSVSRALAYLNIEHKVCSLGDAGAIGSAEKLILPGVGTFLEGARRLKTSGAAALLRDQVLYKKKPILGICLGMQLLASYGEEGGGAEGLGFMKGKVLAHRAGSKGLLIPQIGWNDVDGSELSIFNEIEKDTCFYFIHSYELILEEEAKIATCHYGEDFVAGFEKGNIAGVQFHPEKSQKAGLRLLDNFCRERVLC